MRANRHLRIKMQQIEEQIRELRTKKNLLRYELTNQCDHAHVVEYDDTGHMGRTKICTMCGLEVPYRDDDWYGFGAYVTKTRNFNEWASNRI